ncbi:hypothetical protein GA0070616_1100 [Micromonospora nigra]|uniref:Uncharacterized protein n=1 Tax=Micromonospora nigra TaxID=145857 RepID=A0A1C6RI55_9ACTN|nr:hypothetical protein [Micromonospora nigra]SCL16731.1 hypothetical protein GA0070616_1100 [Micromonospora nigra]
MENTEETRITGRVARVVSIRDLIINRGRQHGVVEDQVFKVLDGDPYKVEDPETGQLLGEIRRVKVLVKVKEVSDLFCIARTYRTRRINTGGRGATFSLEKMFQPPKYEYLVETLERHPRQREVDPDKALIEVGDPVESLLSDENDDDIASIAVWE